MLWRGLARLFVFMTTSQLVEPLVRPNGSNIALHYDPNPVTNTDTTTTLTLNVGSAVSSGTHTVLIKGMGGGVTRSAPITVKVTKCIALFTCQ